MMTTLRLPLPLGGSSNHFHTATPREVGGWDPYNVTEDADLGMRLARFGYRAGVIDSTTYEEAPARFGPWLRQRTRWFKGWTQTWAVQEPGRLLRDLGLPGFLTFQLVAAAMHWRRKCIHCSWLALSIRWQAGTRCGAAIARPL